MESKWIYEFDENNNALIYDHTGGHVTTAENSNPPRIKSVDGIPNDPDVRGAICDYVCFRYGFGQGHFLTLVASVLVAHRLLAPPQPE